MVDAWIPSHNLVFEADGPFHNDPKRELLRDKYLREKNIIAVIHLTLTDLDGWKVKNA